MAELKKVAITTDSNSGIFPEEAEKLGIFVVPMPFLINATPYLENVNLTQEKFFEMLTANAAVATSQPSIGDLMELWENILKTYDEIVHIPMSSGLSQACATATNIAKDFDGRVFVADNHRISVPMKESIFDAITLRDMGKNAAEIKEYLEETANQSSIYIAVDTMKYLKRGGRVTPAAAMIGGILKIKPVLQIHGERLDKYALARSTQKAKETIKTAIKNDLANEYAEYVKKGEMSISVAYTYNEAEGKAFFEELKTAFPDIPVHYCDPLSLSIACHVGPNAIGAACTRSIKK